MSIAGETVESASSGAGLLAPSDPCPHETVNGDGASPFVLVCEHAGRAVPAALGDLGVAPAEMERHIAYDIGAEILARDMAAVLDAPLVLQRYSRLVVDCNRPLAAPDCMPPVSDGTLVPANADLSDSERTRRYGEIHQPFHGRIAALLDTRLAAGRETILIAVHSFTPVLAGRARSCEVGALSHRDPSFGRAFLDAFALIAPSVKTAENAPYSVDDVSDYTIPVHGERRGIPHLLLEVRNDALSSDAACRRWSDLLCRVAAAARLQLNEERRGHGR